MQRAPNGKHQPNQALHTLKLVELNHKPSPSQQPTNNGLHFSAEHCIANFTALQGRPKAAVYFLTYLRSPLHRNRNSQNVFINTFHPLCHSDRIGPQFAHGFVWSARSFGMVCNTSTHTHTTTQYNTVLLQQCLRIEMRCLASNREGRLQHSGCSWRFLELKFPRQGKRNVCFASFRVTKPRS